MKKKDLKSGITILLADDHTIFRQGLIALLRAEEGMTVVGEARTSGEAVEFVQTLQPEIIVLDIMMPDYNGLRAAHMILEQDPEIGVIILSMSADEEFVTQAISSGVKGYLIKEAAAGELIKAIREVHRGNAYLSPEVSKVLLEAHRNKTVKKSASLTVREKEILEMVAAGKTSKEIAENLCISDRTVHKHRQQIMEKLNIHDVASLTRYAMQKRMI